MSFYNRFSSIILLVVMVFSIGRYQIPYIEYSLFEGYIAKNLCVKKEIKGNCCQGKCFLKKQLKLVDDNENTKANSTNTNNKKVHTIEVDDFIVYNKLDLINSAIKMLLFFKSETVITSNSASDIFVPPKQLS